VQRAQQRVDLGPEDSRIVLRERPLEPREGGIGLAARCVRLGHLIGGLMAMLAGKDLQRLVGFGFRNWLTSDEK